MKFGLSFLPNCNPTQKSAAQYYEEILELCVTADKAKFFCVKMTEHYLHPYGGYCPNPLMFLSHVAAKTKHLRLMTGCILAAFHHPLQIASHAALLDVLSNGRADIGFARAYLPYEFSAFNVPIDESRDRFEKTILSVLNIWQNSNVVDGNDYYQCNPNKSLPLTIQNPHPPVWGAAVNARQTFSWLGENGLNLLVSPPFDSLFSLKEKINIYRESFVKHHPNKNPTIALSMPVILDEEQDRAEKNSDIYLAQYISTWSKACDSWNNFYCSDYPRYTNLSEILKMNTPQKMRDDFQVVVGNPKNAKKLLQEIKNELEIDCLLLQLDCGVQPKNILNQSLNLFISEVVPNFN